VGDDGAGGRGGKLLAKTGWNRDKDVDLVELNEAFAVAAIAVTRQLKLNPEKVNVNGGAVPSAIPSGRACADPGHLALRIAAAQPEARYRRLCLGGGNAVALAVERF